MYPRDRLASPEIPANTVLAARRATNAIERIFFHYFLIGKEREAICLYVERRFKSQK